MSLHEAQYPLTSSIVIDHSTGLPEKNTHWSSQVKTHTNITSLPVSSLNATMAGWHSIHIPRTSLSSRDYPSYTLWSSFLFRTPESNTHRALSRLKCPMLCTLWQLFTGVCINTVRSRFSKRGSPGTLGTCLINRSQRLHNIWTFLFQSWFLVNSASLPPLNTCKSTRTTGTMYRCMIHLHQQKLSHLY